MERLTYRDPGGGVGLVKCRGLLEDELSEHNSAVYLEAISKLADYEEAESESKTLTLAQLKKMHGEPVWISNIEEWAIVSVDKEGIWKGKPFVVGPGFSHDIRKRKYICYRQKLIFSTANSKPRQSTPPEVHTCQACPYEHDRLGCRYCWAGYQRYE